MKQGITATNKPIPVLYAVLSCSVISDSLRPCKCSPTGSSVHGDSPGKNAGVGSHSLLQDLPNPGIKPRSPALQADSLPSEPPGKPKILQWVAYPFSRGTFQPRIKLGSPALQVDSLPTELPCFIFFMTFIIIQNYLMFYLSKS